MNTLVVYYSRTGHNEQLAKELCEQMQADLDQIVDLKNREVMVGCVMASIFKTTTRIRFSKDPGSYDQVVVVTPLWGGALPPATRTYLAQNQAKINDFALISICGRGEENQDAMTDISNTARKRPFAALLIKETEVDSEASRQKCAAFVSKLALPEAMLVH